MTGRSNALPGVRLAAAVVLVASVLSACASGSQATAVPPTTSLAPIVQRTAVPPGSIPGAATTGRPAGSIPSFRHVYLVVMENKEYSSVVGSRQARYIDSLIARYGLATGFFAETHPSEPNYVAMVSGGTQGVTNDRAYNLTAPSLFDELDASGRSWHVYAQGYPGGCYTGSIAAVVTDGPGLAGEYVRKHNPAIGFTAISRDPARCARISSLAGFDPASADFEMVIPNQYNDMHNRPPFGSAVGVGDAFLRAFLPSILESPAFGDSVVFITWDEGGTANHGGGHIATLVLSPGMTPGYTSSVEYTHYSLLRTIEQAWDLPFLGQAATAAPMLFPY